MKQFLSKYGKLILFSIGFLIVAGLVFWAYTAHMKTVNQVKGLTQERDSLKRDNAQKDQAVNSAQEDKKLTVRDTIFQTNIKYVQKQNQEQAKRINSADVYESIELYKNYISSDSSTYDPEGYGYPTGSDSIVAQPKSPYKDAGRGWDPKLLPKFLQPQNSTFGFKQ